MRESKPELNIQELPNARIAIVVAKWNRSFNDEMSESAQEVLAEARISVDCFEVPGAFEMPFFVQKLAETDDYDAIICFGTVIRGATKHFDLVAEESARGLMDVSLNSEIPVFNGILACENTEQAEFRASKQKEDKGREVALSAIDLLVELEKISSVPLSH